MDHRFLRRKYMNPGLMCQWNFGRAAVLAQAVFTGDVTLSFTYKQMIMILNCVEDYHP